MVGGGGREEEGARVGIARRSSVPLKMAGARREGFKCRSCTYENEPCSNEGGNLGGNRSPRLQGLLWATCLGRWTIRPLETSYVYCPLSSYNDYTMTFSYGEVSRTGSVDT